MYDYEYNMSRSQIAWAQVMDLTKVIAADNEIETIAPAFPDGNEGEDSQTTPFGAVELLDFHGNLLSNLPRGLAQLEAITSLNLVSLPTIVLEQDLTVISPAIN